MVYTSNVSSTIFNGGTNVGSVDHISGLIFAREAKTKIAFVPFEGGGAIMTNLVGAQIDAAGLNLDEGKDQLESGELRVLAVMADERLSALPDTPTLKEKGINASFATVRGVVVPVSYTHLTLPTTVFV